MEPNSTWRNLLSIASAFIDEADLKSPPSQVVRYLSWSGRDEMWR